MPPVEKWGGEWKIVYEENCVSGAGRGRERRQEGGHEGMKAAGRETHVHDPSFTFSLCANGLPEPYSSQT